MNHPEHPTFRVPGVGRGLIIGQPEPAEVPPEVELRRRTVERLQATLPPWARQGADFTATDPPPIFVYLIQSLLHGDVGLSEEELPKLVTVIELAASKFADPAVAAQARRSELKRLLILGDYALRRAFPGTITHLGYAEAARMLRAHPPIRTAKEVISATAVLESLAETTATTLAAKAATDEGVLLAISALSFTGLFFRSLLDLLRRLQDALFAPVTAPEAVTAGQTIATTAPQPRPEAAQGADVMVVDAAMVRDLVNYILAVYGAARTVAFASLGGKGAQIEVERGMLACVVELRDA